MSDQNASKVIACYISVVDSIAYVISIDTDSKGIFTIFDDNSFIEKSFAEIGVWDVILFFKNEVALPNMIGVLSYKNNLRKNKLIKILKKLYRKKTVKFLTEIIGFIFNPEKITYQDDTFIARGSLDAIEVSLYPKKEGGYGVILNFLSGTISFLIEAHTWQLMKNDNRGV